MTEAEKRQILLAEWLQRKAEDDFYARQSKKVARRTQSLLKEISYGECFGDGNDD